MKIYKDFVQGSPEWFAIRKGKITASHADTIAVAGKGLETYIWGIMADHYATTENSEEGYTNAHMERGKELEEHARSIFELETGHTVDQVGFIEYDQYTGCSPDGLIGEDELLEIKCHDNTKHFRLIVEGAAAIDPGYIMQIQMNLLISERKKAYYVAYNPNFEKSLLVFEILPDMAAYTKLMGGFVKAKDIMISIMERLSL